MKIYKLPFFPSPYPDELLYSVVSRFHLRSCNCSYKFTTKMLLGTSDFGQCFDSLNNLELISRKLPSGDTSTVMRLVMNHTMFPLYRPFSMLHWRDFTTLATRPHNRKCLFKIPGGRKWYKRKKSSQSYFLEPIKGEQRFLRFCPECLLFDCGAFGESYWHRSHQIHGLDICHKHGSKLVETDIETMPSTRNIRYALPDMEMITRTCVKQEASAIQRLAGAACWLLNCGDDLIGPEDVKKLYRNTLKEKELSRCIDTKRLLLSLEAYCRVNGVSAEPIMLLKYDSLIWIKSLIDPKSFDSHPVDHLVFMDYLGISTTQLILNPNRALPIGHESGHAECCGRAFRVG